MPRLRHVLWLWAVLAFITTPLTADARSTLKNHITPVTQNLRVAVRNSLSNIDFYQDNDGGLFFNSSGLTGAPGTFWPRGTDFSMIYGGGAWFGAVKHGVHHVLLSFNTYNGGSWFQPGTVASAQAYRDSAGHFPTPTDDDYGKHFSVYDALQYDRTTGRPLNPALGLPNWPIWDTDTSTSALVGSRHYFGNYVADEQKRDTSTYPVRFVPVYTQRYDSAAHKTVTDTTVVRKGGPSFVSEEDMFSVVNELDTTYDVQKSDGRFYPLHCELQRTIYSWGSQENKDFIFVVYRIINRSAETLDSCWFGPVADPDIGYAANDENGFYDADPSLNLGIQWSDCESNVPGAKVSPAFPPVLGFDFLESPTVYQRGEVPDSLVGSIKPGFYPSSQQLGLQRFKRWRINDDPTDDEARYISMAAVQRDVASDPPEYSDKRILMATGPFRLLPGQSAQVAIGVIMARDSVLGDSNVEASMAACVALDKKAQIVYDNEYAVNGMSLPPTEPKFTAAIAGNHRITVRWDSLSEYSYDPFVGGLDFMGYRLYRGRRDSATWYKKIAEWKLSDLDSATYANLRAHLPSDLASAEVRTAFYNSVHHLMDSLTNGRTYVDTGDDNHDGTVADSERILNDVDYFYWIAAFDEGAPDKNIPSQESTPVNGRITARAASSDSGPSPSYIALPSQGALGGVNHFTWEVQNAHIINQLLAGDTVSVSFQPLATDVPGAYRSYMLNAVVADRRGQIADTVLLPASGFHQPPAYAASFYSGGGTPVFFAGATVPIQTSVFGEQFDSVYTQRMGYQFHSGAVDFGSHSMLLNALTYTFRNDISQCVEQQYTWDTVLIRDTVITTNNATHVRDTAYPLQAGRPLRVGWVLSPYALAGRRAMPTLGKITGSRISTTVVGGNTVETRTTQWTTDTVRTGMDPFAILSGRDSVPTYWNNSGNIWFDSLADHGAYDYILTFTKGGIDTIAVKGFLYVAPYLNVTVQCEQIFSAKDVTNHDSLVVVSSPGIAVTDVSMGSLGVNQWLSEAIAWILSPGNNTDAGRSTQYAGFPFSHSTKKYYLTAHGLPPVDTAWIVFVNRFRIGGNYICLDSAFKTTTRFQHDNFPGQFLRPATHDLRAGDVMRIRYTGGVLGLPAPGATINTLFKYFVGIHDTPVQPVSPLSSVDAWPNPVHGRREHLELNNLPDRCEIQLCTIAGACLARFRHQGGTNEAIDLAAAGIARLGTQLLVVRVVTPDGQARALKIVMLGDSQ